MSSDNDTASLIESLTGQLEPVKKLAHPLHRIMPSLVVAVVYLGLVVYLIGLRGDMLKMPQNPNFLFEVSLSFTMAVSAFLASAWCCVPDMRGQRWLLALPITLFYALCLFQLSHMMATGLDVHDAHYVHCIHDGILMIVLPMALVTFFTRKGATTRPYMQMFMNVLAVTGLGYAGLRFTCSVDHMDHIFLYHTLPFMLVGMVFGLLARRFFAW